MIRLFGILLLYTSITLILLEISLYIIGIPKNYALHSAPLQFSDSRNENINYTNLRSSSIDFIYDRNPRGYFRNGNVVNHVTNSAGFRGPEILKFKQENTRRALFLGDSITFGEGVYFEDTYPEQFKSMANEKDIFGKKVESINLGVGGYNAMDNYRVLEYATDFDPDLVVVTYSLNDADKPIFIRDEDNIFMRAPTDLEDFIARIKGEPDIIKLSRILSIITHWYKSEVISRETENFYHALYSNNSASWLETQTAIRYFGEYKKTNHADIVFILFPELFHLNKYPFTEELKKIKDELRKNDLQYIDLLPLLSDYKDSELWVHPTDHHPNEIVHQIAAEALIKELTKAPSK